MTRLAASLFLPILTLCAQPPVTIILAGRLIDVRSGRVAAKQEILVEGDRIRQVGASLPHAAGAKIIDLGQATSCPA